MKNDTKIILGIILATIVIIIGGVFFFSQGGKSTTTTSGVKVDNNLLIRSDSYKISSPSAQVTLVEFGDYQCPACGSYFPVVQQVLTQFQGTINFVFRNFPLNQHQNARIAAQSAEAAGLQGKFWPMFDMIYGNQSTWSDLPNARDTFVSYAKNIGLNLDQFKKDVDSDKIKQKIDRDVSDGNSLGVDSTPTFFLNSEKIQNPSSYDDFSTLVKAAILKNPITQTPTAAYHIHADFRLYINGNPLDFSQTKYQSVEGKELDPDVHLHNSNGYDIHIHKKGVTLGQFFKSLHITFSSNCLTLDTGEKYCNDSSNSLKMYVNGKQNNQFDKYAPVDLDRILISYGQANDSQISNQLSSVSDMACLYSNKCPERGKPPTENCVGGLGTNCNE